MYGQCMSDISDRYAATAGLYDLMASSYRPAQLAALESLLAVLSPEAGPVLDLGAGSALNTMVVLDRVPEAHVFAIEPSATMRALILDKLAARPDRHHRVTVRPEDFFSAPLPDRLGGAIALGVLGHFDPGERAAVIAEIADRLPVGGAALFDLQAPARPQRVEPFEFTVADIGDLTYRAIAEAWPVDEDRMRWRMSYLTLEGERVLVEDTVEHEFHHPDPARVSEEAEQVGARLQRLGESTFWLLTR